MKLLAIKKKLHKTATILQLLHHIGRKRVQNAPIDKLKFYVI